MNAIALCERGLIPDSLARWGMRRLCTQRLRQEQHSAGKMLAQVDQAPLAVETEAANSQHYELPPGFFELTLGRHLKYSACLWEPGTASLDAAEAAMLKLSCERAGLENGQQVLELGCGWGSMSLWIAAEYPQSSVLAVSNSRPQREYIQQLARRRGLKNIQVVTADINDFDPGQRFDRIVSVEMFEHVRNHGLLLQRIGGWLEPGGSLFVHIFCHRKLTYTFETEGSANWMGRTFFTGGMMPDFDLFKRLESPLAVDQQWWIDGTHYAKTSEAWLARMDQNHAAVLRIMQAHYGKPEAAVWLQRWRMFYMAVAELFAYRNGQEWGVGHYRLVRKAE